MQQRNYNIDYLKAFAIVSVISLHALTSNILFNIGAPFYIWQAMPIFMVLNGLNNATSNKRRGNGTLSSLYNVKTMIGKLIKVLRPFIIVWLFQSMFLLMSNGIQMRTILIGLALGGWGPGSYFIPIIIQATLLTPLIYWTINKFEHKGLIGIFFASTVLELLVSYLNVSDGLYRLLIIRYIFAIAVGVWFALLSKRVQKKWINLLGGISFIYILGVNYFDWHFITEHMWLSQHAPSYFWTLLLIIFGLNFYKINGGNVLSKSILLIGRASYHIFFIQMIYFWAVHPLLISFNILINIVLSITISCILGVAFYYFDNWLGTLKFLKALT